MVYNMDHDFVSIQKERNEEFEELYRRGLKSYIDGDWFGASTAWQMASELSKKDEPLKHMMKVLDKGKNAAPENWNHGYDWDLKPEPPEIDY